MECVQEGVAYLTGSTISITQPGAREVLTVSVAGPSIQHASKQQHCWVGCLSVFEAMADVRKAQLCVGLATVSLQVVREGIMT